MIVCKLGATVSPIFFFSWVNFRVHRMAYAVTILRNTSLSTQHRRGACMVTPCSTTHLQRLNPWSRGLIDRLQFPVPCTIAGTSSNGSTHLVPLVSAESRVRTARAWSLHSLLLCTVNMQLGLDRANSDRHTDMKEHFVIDPLISKRQQLLLATQLCRMVLKVRCLPYPYFISSCTCFFTRTRCHSVPRQRPSTSAPALATIPCIVRIPLRGTGKRARMQVTVAPCKTCLPLPMSRTAGDVHGCTTFRSCPQIPSILCFPSRPCLRPSPPRFAAFFIVTCWILLTGMQVNNVIIAGSDDNEF